MNRSAIVTWNGNINTKHHLRNPRNCYYTISQDSTKRNLFGRSCL